VYQVGINKGKVTAVREPLKRRSERKNWAESGWR